MLWDIAYVICWVTFKIFYRFKVVGRENVPKEGAVIFVSNHKSYLDPIIVGLACYPRRISFMAKEELFHTPILKHLVKWFYAFPVRRRKTDREALKISLNLLSEGKALGLFPEGTRYRQEGVGEAHPGVAMLALRSGVPIVPIGLIGTDKVFPEGRWIPRFPKIRARVGTPFTVGKKRDSIRREELAELTEKVMTQIANLVDSLRLG